MNKNPESLLLILSALTVFDAPVDRGIAHLDRGRVLIEAGLVTERVGDAADGPRSVG